MLKMTENTQIGKFLMNNLYFLYEVCSETHLFWAISEGIFFLFKNLRNKEVKKMKRSKFFMVGNVVFDIGLSPVCFVVYCYLCRCTDKDGICYPSKKTIARSCRIAVSSVSKSIKELASVGLIQITHNSYAGRQTNNTYQVADLIRR